MIQFKILSDGRLIIERSDDISNKELVEILSPHITNPIELNNFLSQWQNSEIICGRPDLCG